jgi:hypothetical protein
MKAKKEKRKKERKKRKENVPVSPERKPVSRHMDS